MCVRMRVIVDVRVIMGWIIVHVIVMMVIMRVIVSSVAEGRAQPINKQAQADDDDYPAGDKAKDGKESFGNDVLRGEQCHQAEREDACCVRNRHREAEKSRVLPRAARADQVRADHGFAVTGRERMRRTERRGDEQAEERERQREFRHSNQLG